MLILASESPRRKELLRYITEDFLVEAPEVDETVDGTLSPEELVEELARRKGQAVWERHQNARVIAADTVVVLKGKILGKPKDRADAKEMLRTLSGEVHHVYTGVAIFWEEGQHVFHVASKVEFASLSPKEIEDYIATGEPMDKAGAYGIQGYGSRFVKNIEGDYFSIMGLPVHRLYKKLTKLGFCG